MKACSILIESLIRDAKFGDLRQMTWDGEEEFSDVLSELVAAKAQAHLPGGRCSFV